MADNTQLLTGKFLGAGKTESVGQNNYLIRKFWLDITTNPEYPNTPEFKLKGDKVTLVDNLRPGQTIQVKYQLEGRKYESQSTGKKGVITDVVAWKIDVVQLQSSTAPQPVPARQPAPAPSIPAVTNPSRPAPVAGGFAHVGQAGGDDDLPF